MKNTPAEQSDPAANHPQPSFGQGDVTNPPEKKSCGPVARWFSRRKAKSYSHRRLFYVELNEDGLTPLLEGKVVHGGITADINDRKPEILSVSIRPTPDGFRIEGLPESWKSLALYGTAGVQQKNSLEARSPEFADHQFRIPVTGEATNGRDSVGWSVHDRLLVPAAARFSDSVASHPDGLKAKVIHGRPAVLNVEGRLSSLGCPDLAMVELDYESSAGKRTVSVVAVLIAEYTIANQGIARRVEFPWPEDSLGANGTLRVRPVTRHDVSKLDSEQIEIFLSHSSCCPISVCENTFSISLPLQRETLAARDAWWYLHATLSE